jgi:hypothetical protein
VSDHAFDVDGDRFADVGDGLIERIPFGVAAGQGRAHRVVAAFGLGFKNCGETHDRESIRFARPWSFRQFAWMEMIEHLLRGGVDFCCVVGGTADS